MSDNFFDKDVSKEPVTNGTKNDDIDSQQVNINEALGDSNATTENPEHENRDVENVNEDHLGIFERNSNVGSVDGQKGNAYSFWAEQIATTAADKKENPYQNPFYKGYLDDQTKKEQQNGAYLGDRAEYSSQGDGVKNKKKSKAGRFTKFVVGAAVFGLIAGATFVGFNAVYYKVNPNAVPITVQLGGRLSNNGIYINPPLDKDKQLATTSVSQGTIEQKTDITDVVDKTMSSIVTIATTYTQSYYDWFGQQLDRENLGGGSGIIVSKNDKELLIATNNHVVEGANPIKVQFIDGTEAEAIIKGTDAVADLAVISIDLSDIKPETLDAITVAALGDSDAVKVGQMAVAIGNALGYGQSTTVGYISAKDRQVQVDDKTMVLLQTDAAINPGNSGGALINLKGEVIGINTVKYASSEVEGMGFAIPISRAIPIIDELMNREVLKDNEKGYLGVSYSDVTEEIAAMYNWPIGVYVKEALEDGSAYKAGILTGDIITKVNDTEITAGTQLKEKVTSYRVGTDITITVMRGINGQFEEKQLTVTLGGIPETTTE